MSGKRVLLAMAALALLFVGGLVFVVRQVPRYDPQPATNLRRIQAAQERYREQDPDQDGPDYATLAELAEWQLVDPGVGSGTRAGYHFFVRPLGEGWVGVANPVTPGESGERYYGIDQRGVVVWSQETPFALDAALPADAQTLAADAAR